MRFVRALLIVGRRAQQPCNATLVGVVAAHHPAVVGAEAAVDDGVDDRIDREMFGPRQRGEALGMPQQHVQELVADHAP